jgi:mono/diheme cytochrome c family protein
VRRALLALVVAACARRVDGPVAPEATVTFKVDGRVVRTLSLGDLARVAPPRTITGWDPYYQRVKRFAALPLEAVLREGLGPPEGYRGRSFVLRARDGYTVPLEGARLLEGGAHLAVRDLDSAAWSPIGPQRANPGPAYLIWSGAAQVDLTTHPRPWQLASIEVARFEDVFPHTVPAGEPRGTAAWTGFAVFARECVRCHAVNREGGRVGPDLNVPQSVVEYRPEAQLRAYIRDPRTFRYGTLPAHPHLRDAELDGLLAYFHAMRARKHDPDAHAPAGHAP